MSEQTWDAPHPAGLDGGTLTCGLTIPTLDDFKAAIRDAQHRMEL